jgi:hypothetical protein
LGVAYARDGQWEQSKKSFPRAIEREANRSESYGDFVFLPIASDTSGSSGHRLATIGDHTKRPGRPLARQISRVRPPAMERDSESDTSTAICSQAIGVVDGNNWWYR